MAIVRAPAGERAADAPRRPAWVPTVAAIVTIVVCILAGNWQYRRMLEKEALQAQVGAAAAAAPVPLPQGVTDWRAWRFRTITMTGQFDARHQILIDNKVHAGRAGYAVVAPFMVDDGRTVLVDRGWIPGGATRSTLPSPLLPQGRITLLGRVAIPPTGYLQLGDRSVPAGPVWQHLDPPRFAEATGVRVLPIVIEALDMPGNDQLVHDASLPDPGVGKHVAYMMQWYTFAAMAAGLWLWFTLRPLLKRARRR